MVQMIPALPVGTRRGLFLASRQPELDREEYQSVGHLYESSKTCAPASRPVDFSGLSAEDECDVQVGSPVCLTLRR